MGLLLSMANHKKIKIAFIIDSINSVSGTEKQLIQLIERLDRKIFDPVLICLRPPIAALNLDTNKIQYIQLNFQSILSIQGVASIFSLGWFLKKNKFDLVQTYFVDSSIVGVIAARLAGIKKVICCRRDLGFWYTSRLLKALRIINKFVFRFLVNSNEVKDVTVRNEGASPDKVHVIYNGIDMAPFEIKYDKDEWKQRFRIKKDYYVVGTLVNFSRPVKRVDIFIKAAAQLLKKQSNITFIVVGGGYLRDEMENLTRQLHIENNIIFTGVQEDIYPLLSFWDVGVISSDSEGFSNSILEYMAAGIPVVATDVGGNKELIKQGVNGFLIAPGDYEALGKRVLSLLRDKKKQQMIRDNAIDLVKRDYDWNVKIKEIEEYYKNLLKYF